MVVVPLPQEIEKIANPVGFLEKGSQAPGHVLVTTFNDVMRVGLYKVGKR
jgi:hypothetical protein